MENEITKRINSDALPKSYVDSVFSNMEIFRSKCEMAAFLANSEMVPDAFKKKTENCLIALDIADRMEIPVLSIMRSMSFIHGKWGWEAKFKISCFNQSGRFTPVRYEEIGEVGTDTWGKRAYAKDRSGNICRGPAVTIAIAKKEGWFSKPGSKWQSMPELMLMYRSASMMIDVYDPSISLGFNTVDELEDIGFEQEKNITPTQNSEKGTSAVDRLAKKIGAGSKKQSPEQPAIDVTTAPGEPKISELIHAEIERSGAPITVADVERYLISINTATGDIDNPESYSEKNYRYTIENIEKLVKKVAELNVSEPKQDGLI